MKKFLNSFRYAGKGVIYAIKHEQNMRVHMCVAFYIMLFAPFFTFTKAELCILAICTCGVLALETVNSAIERAVANPAPGSFYIAGVVKDLAAGAVLLFSFGALVCGLVLFWQPLGVAAALSFYLSSPLRMALLGLSFAGAAYFIFKKEE